MLMATWRCQACCALRGDEGLHVQEKPDHCTDLQRAAATFEWGSGCSDLKWGEEAVLNDRDVYEAHHVLVAVMGTATPGHICNMSMLGVAHSQVVQLAQQPIPWACTMPHRVCCAPSTSAYAAGRTQPHDITVSAPSSFPTYTQPLPACSPVSLLSGLSARAVSIYAASLLLCVFLWHLFCCAAIQSSRATRLADVACERLARLQRSNDLLLPVQLRFFLCNRLPQLVHGSCGSLLPACKACVDAISAGVEDFDLAFAE